MKKIILTLLVFFIILALLIPRVFGMQNYYKTDFSTGIVTATNLNVRSGPGTYYQVIGTVKKNEYIRVFAGIGDWYIVQTDSDVVGAVSKKYVRAIYPSSSGSSSSSSNTTTTSSMNANEKEVFDLINQQRANNGLSALKLDEEVQRVARIKAQDMVDNNYFAHESPTYGTPFQMLTSFKISYTAAGENIAGNSTNSGAVTAWMNSSGHKANILNSNYTHTGIGVVSSNKYGKIYVQIFIKK
ncbi:MAG: SH3 domain-containing protein [Clostridia bacterium]|nr:SH3 domain-containing protein [Clostridia bacterium]